MKHFLSCDWGTSSFRLKLVDTRSLQTLAELQNSHGIAATNANWQNTGTGHRFLFFASIIASGISLIEDQIHGSLSGIPVILSGMASSTLGMIQLPYKQMPFKTDGSDLKIEYVKASAEFEHDVFAISGICSNNDVMRGEETQLVGAVDAQSDVAGVYIFPGTHSKHISVKDGAAYEFRTYMTGEIFSLLSKNSTLSESIGDTPPGALGPIGDDFIVGVKDSVGSNLLHQLFRVRTRFLLDKKEPLHNKEYMSGLLIGNELQELSRWKTEKIVIVSSAMGDHYKAAIQVFDNSLSVSLLDDRDVAIRGQLRIVSHMVV